MKSQDKLKQTILDKLVMLMLGQ